MTRVLLQKNSVVSLTSSWKSCRKITSLCYYYSSAPSVLEVVRQILRHLSALQFSTIDCLLLQKSQRKRILKWICTFFFIIPAVNAGKKLQPQSAKKACILLWKGNSFGHTIHSESHFICLTFSPNSHSSWIIIISFSLHLWI